MVCVPIVVVGAPFGARFICQRSRLFVAGILYVSIATSSWLAIDHSADGWPDRPERRRVHRGHDPLPLMARGGLWRLAWLP